MRSLESVDNNDLNIMSNWQLIFLVLAREGYLMDSSFLYHLRELHCAKEPNYARFLQFPICLAFLDLLQQENLPLDLCNDLFVSYLHHALFRRQIKPEQHTLPNISSRKEEIRYESLITRWERYIEKVRTIQRTVSPEEIWHNAEITRWCSYSEF